MRAEVQYKSKIFGECPSDYDFTKITNSEELKLLNWITTYTLGLAILERKLNKKFIKEGEINFED